VSRNDQTIAAPRRSHGYRANTPDMEHAEGCAPERRLAFLFVGRPRRSSDRSARRGTARERPSGRTQAVFYRDAAGHEPVDAFVEDLLKAQPLAAAKIDAAIEEHLNGRDPGAPPPGFPTTSQIDGELRELRVRFARTRYRILYQRSGNLMVLLHAFEKQTGAVPARDRETAKRWMADFRARMDAASRRPPRAAGRDAPPRSRRD
jgi:phage-related protein